MSDQLEQLDVLISSTWQPRWKRVLVDMRNHLHLPMQEVLERVPGEYVRDKIAAIGCVRTTYYDWIRENYRPNAVQAKRLAELTGLPAEEIRGHDLGRETAQTSVAVAKGRAAASGVHGGGGGAPGRVVSSPGRGRGVRALRRRAHRRPSKGEDEQ